jgi:hypothetical protein
MAIRLIATAARTTSPATRARAGQSAATAYDASAGPASIHSSIVRPSGARRKNPAAARSARHTAIHRPARLRASGLDTRASSPNAVRTERQKLASHMKRTGSRNSPPNGSFM